MQRCIVCSGFHFREVTFRRLNEIHDRLLCSVGVFVNKLTMLTSSMLNKLMANSPIERKLFASRTTVFLRYCFITQIQKKYRAVVQAEQVKSEVVHN